MKTLRIMAALLVLYSQLAEATTYYVRTTGSGSTCSLESPCASIVTGIGKVQGAGDVVDIGAGTFTEITGAVVPASGANGNPIIIQAPGIGFTIWRRTNCAVTTIGCAVSITDKSYIRFTGIKFKDFSGKTTIDILSTTGTHSGIEVINSAAENVGNTGVGSTDYSKFVYSYGPGAHANYIFTGNSFTDVYGAPLQLRGLDTALIDSNTVTSGHASRAGASNNFQFLIRGLVQVGTGSKNFTITNNTITNLEKDSYIADFDPLGTGCGGGRCKWQGGIFYFDAGALNNLVQGNLIQNINTLDSSFVSFAVLIFESGVNGNTAKNNILIGVDGNVIGFQNGSYNTSANNTNTFDGNSFRGAGCPFSAMNTTSYVVKNNIFYSTDTSHWIVGESNRAAGGLYQNNLYYNAGGGSILALNTSGTSNCGSANTSFATWQANGTPTNVTSTSELNANPLYTSTTDLHLQAGSPAIDTGVNGVDMGAYSASAPPPLGTITVTYPNTPADLLVGFTVNFTWDSINVSGNDKVELSRDNGVTWETLSASVADSAHSLSWVVTAPGRVTQGLLKVTSLSNPSVFGVSDVPFQIHGIYLSVLP